MWSNSLCVTRWASLLLLTLPWCGLPPPALLPECSCAQAAGAQTPAEELECANREQFSFFPSRFPYMCTKAVYAAVFSWARQPLSAKGYCCESGCLFPQLKTPESHGPEASWPATWEGLPLRAWIIKKVHRFLSVWKPVINRGLSRDCENLILMFLKGEEPVFVFNRGSVGIFSVWDGWYLCALRKVSTSGVSLCPPII